MTTGMSLNLAFDIILILFPDWFVCGPETEEVRIVFKDLMTDLITVFSLDTTPHFSAERRLVQIANRRVERIS